MCEIANANAALANNWNKAKGQPARRAATTNYCHRKLLFNYDFTGKSTIYHIRCSGTYCSPWADNVHQLADVGKIASCPHSLVYSVSDTRIVR